MLPWGVASAAPTVSIEPHRLSGPAPLYVHFDATGTTSSIAGDRALSDLLYRWEFEPSLLPVWSTTGLPKNRADGPVAAHVFDAPGTYTVSVTVTDRTLAETTQTVTITVEDPDVHWATTTHCVSASGDFSGCPPGGVQHTSSDFDAAMSTRMTLGARRILFRRGETFISSTSWNTPSNVKTEGLVSAYGEGAQPVIEIAPSNTSAVILLAGASTSTYTSGGWRFVDLRITSPSGTSARGFGTSFAVENILVYKMDIGPTGTGFNFGADHSGLSVPHRNFAMIDTHLRGNTPIAIGQGGACWFGGADYTAIMGVVCDLSNNWQMRIINTHKMVMQHNRINSVLGAFEATKLHCSLLSSQSDRDCHHAVVSDNIWVAARFNIFEGSSTSPGTIEDSIFERNIVGGCLEMGNPNNVVRHNVARCYSFPPRVASAMPVNNLLENNTCDGRSVNLSCVMVESGANVDGLMLRNNLAYAPTSRPLLDHDGTGTVTQQTNVMTTVVPWAVASPDPLVLADYQLAAGSPHINAGTNSIGRRFDAILHLAPSGIAPDIGALEFEEGAPVDLPPGAPTILSVEVQP